MSSENPYAFPRVGVGAVIWRDEKILLIHRKGAHGAGTWAPPGGHLDYGESFEACAERETLEETGIRVKALRILSTTNDLWPELGRHFASIWMECRYLSGEAAPVAAEELDAARWFPKNALPKNLFGPFRELLKITGKIGEVGFA